MDVPFYRSPKPYFGNFGSPIRCEEAAIPVATDNKKVVQIPIHFVGSDPKPDRSMSAVKVQKVFRGFLVRKSMRKIVVIKKEVDDIEVRVKRNEEVELLKKDEKERLKVNEMLMGLLFKLDSVRGVDPGVRDCRKRVIKKAIALQERVDAIAAEAAAPNSLADVDSMGPVTETLDEEKDDQAEYQVLEINDAGGAAAGEWNLVDKIVCPENQTPQDYDVVVDFGNNGSGQGTGETDKEPLSEVKCSEDLMNWDRADADSEMNTKKDNSGEVVEKEIGIDSEMKVETSFDKLLFDNMENKNGGVGKSSERTPALSECVEESVETNQMEDAMGEEEKNAGRELKGDVTKGNRDLLEKMTQENEKMMKMMTQLFEKSEAQTQMLNTLTHRVEQLEKAFVCGLIKRKKKRQSP